MALGEDFRIATYNPDLSRDGPGILARDIASGKDGQIEAVLMVILRADADILLLTEFDWDHQGTALAALQAALAEAGAPYPHSFAARPNTGQPSGFDLDGDGQSNGRRDRLGYGAFPGHRGMAVLSRHPLMPEAARDFTGFLWQDLPDHHLDAAGLPGEAVGALPLSTTAHWDLPVLMPDGRALHLLAWYATPPSFAPLALNRARNHDEAAFWLHYLDGRLPLPPPDGPFVILGDANADPDAGKSDPTAIRTLLADPRLTDPRPASEGGRAAAIPASPGDPALDTADWSENRNVGDNLRVDYVLPSADLTVRGAGVLWPAPTDPFAATVATASPHRLVWVDIALP